MKDSKILPRSDEIQDYFKLSPRKWLITGVAGFIGSHLLQTLLECEQKVIGIDDFSTGSKENLKDVELKVGREDYKGFDFYEGDILDYDLCLKATKGVDIILHQAALGSVPRSIENPKQTHLVNVDGSLNIFLAGRENKVKKIIYASSSSVYGDSELLPKKEEVIGNPLSPYAVSKRINELYSEVFSKLYGLQIIGLRYFNVFGPRQNPMGPYAAVIPRWINACIKGEECVIYGDGSTTRDFCYVRNVVVANLLAAKEERASENLVYNIAGGGQVNLNQLYELIAGIVKPEIKIKPKYASFREGDVKHSLADIGRARKYLNYEPEVCLEKGLNETIKWFQDLP